MEQFMEKEKQENKDKDKMKNDDKNPQQEPADEGQSDIEESQTMVALTFDEYEALEDEIEALKAAIEEQKDSWLRTLADFDNYKKRVQRDATRSYQDAMSSILKIFLNAADDLERALRSKPKGKEVASWINGIELIHQKLMNQMKNQGIERMDVKPGDEFDPNIHEAITQEDHPDFEDGQIIEVIQPGYRISDRIIRPAMVRVAR
jgi:molecular chaperone GrpE